MARPAPLPCRASCSSLRSSPWLSRSTLSRAISAHSAGLTWSLRRFESARSWLRVWTCSSSNGSSDSSLSKSSLPIASSWVSVLVRMVVVRVPPSAAPFRQMPAVGELGARAPCRRRSDFIMPWATMYRRRLDRCTEHDRAGFDLALLDEVHQRLDCSAGRWRSRAHFDNSASFSPTARRCGPGHLPGARRIAKGRALLVEEQRGDIVDDRADGKTAGDRSQAPCTLAPCPTRSRAPWKPRSIARAAMSEPAAKASTRPGSSWKRSIESEHRAQHDRTGRVAKPSSATDITSAARRWKRPSLP